MDFADLPEGWTVWHTEETKAVLTYRPDVFDTDSFPAPCLPTIHVTKGQRDRRPGRKSPDPDAAWYVTLYLEPEVTGDQLQFDAREDAAAGARSLADSFASGEVDYRSIYQVPRPDYFDRLDDLTGRD